MNPMLYCWVRMYLRLLYFSILWLKIPDGYQIASLEELGLWSTSQLSLWIGVFTQRSELSFRGLLPKVISFILSMLYIEHCLLILPLFVAICEIWLPRLTYGVYLVLFLKPGATSNLPRIQIHLGYNGIQWPRSGGMPSNFCLSSVSRNSVFSFY